MPNFTLTCEHRTPWDCELDSKVTMEFNKETLTDVIAQFQDFLRGCGYYFDGNLEIVEHEIESYKLDPSAYQAFNTMASSLMNPPEQQTTCGNCPVCKLDSGIMQRHQCFDPKCGLK